MSERIENTRVKRRKVALIEPYFCVLTQRATIERLSQILLAKRDAVIDAFLSEAVCKGLRSGFVPSV